MTIPASSSTHHAPTRARVPAAPQPMRVPRSVAFASAEEAWFWTISALAARRDGTGSSGMRTVRACDPDDIVRCLDQLYRRRRIDLVHARILRAWGERGVAPNSAYPIERADAQVWQEAMERLEWPLRVKGIVAAKR